MQEKLENYICIQFLFLLRKKVKKIWLGWDLNPQSINPLPTIRPQNLSGNNDQNLIICLPIR